MSQTTVTPALRALTFAVAGLLHPQVVSSPQVDGCDRLANDSASFRRPAQPSNSLASIPGAAIQSIFQCLEVASAARLASTCKVFSDEHRHQCTAIYERAYQQLVPELNVQLVLDRAWVTITVHWADEVSLLQMYRIALCRNALLEFWSFVWPPNLHQLIWTAAMKSGEHDWLADDCNHYMQTKFFVMWVKAIISCKDCKSPFADAWARDNSLDKTVVKSLGSAWQGAFASLSVTPDADEVKSIFSEFFCHQYILRNVRNSANALGNNCSDLEYQIYIPTVHEFAKLASYILQQLQHIT